MNSMPSSAVLSPVNRFKTFSLLIFIGLFMACVAAAQTQEEDIKKADPPTQKEPPEAPKEKPLLPTAEEILSITAEKQGGAEIAKKLKNFWADFESEFYSPKKGRTQFQVERIFQMPCFLWTKKKHDLEAKPTYEIYNGDDGWFINRDGKATVYTDKPSTYKTDIENLEEDVRITKQMFRFFFIANLRKELTGLKRLSDGTVPKLEGTAYIVEGRATGWIGGENQKTVYLKIFIDPELFEVRAVRMRDPTPGGHQRLFLFEVYEKNRQDISVPTRITMFADQSPEAQMKIYMNNDEEEGEIYPRIKFNIEDKTDLFLLPDEDEE